ncbi:MAG: hypothetical protein ABSB73_10035 [Solirubrobacteraceae bacterium]
MTTQAKALLRGPGGPPFIFKPSDSVLGVFTRAIDGAIVPEITADGSGIDLDLHGCFAKLARAQDHLVMVDDLLKAFFDSDPYGALAKVEGKDGWYVFRVEVRRKPDLRIGVVMGEYAHQVRSAYDHFAYALAASRLRRGHKPPSTIGFPMETSRSEFATKAENRLRDKIPDDWFAVIEALQPYDAHNDTLAILERFWNRDKHQTVVAVPVLRVEDPSGMRYRTSAKIVKRRPRTGVRLVSGAELARIQLATPDSQAHMDMYVEASVEISGESTPDDLYFGDLVGAEAMLRFILSTFAAGRVEQDRAQLTTHYRTVISTLPSRDGLSPLRGFDGLGWWPPKPSEVPTVPTFRPYTSP